ISASSASAGQKPARAGINKWFGRAQQLPPRRLRGYSGRILAQSRPGRQLDDAGAEHRQLAVLVARFLLDVDEVLAVLDPLARYRADDRQHVARRVMPPDLAG